MNRCSPTNNSISSYYTRTSNSWRRVSGRTPCRFVIMSLTNHLFQIRFILLSPSVKKYESKHTLYFVIATYARPNSADGLLLLLRRHNRLPYLFQDMVRNLQQEQYNRQLNIAGNFYQHQVTIRMLIPLSSHHLRDRYRTTTLHLRNKFKLTRRDSQAWMSLLSVLRWLTRLFRQTRLTPWCSTTGQLISSLLTRGRITKKRTPWNWWSQKYSFTPTKTLFRCQLRRSIKIIRSKIPSQRRRPFRNV